MARKSLSQYTKEIQALRNTINDLYSSLESNRGNKFAENLDFGLIASYTKELRELIKLQSEAAAAQGKLKGRTAKTPLFPEQGNIVDIGDPTGQFDWIAEQQAAKERRKRADRLFELQAFGIQEAPPPVTTVIPHPPGTVGAGNAPVAAVPPVPTRAATLIDVLIESLNKLGFSSEGAARVIDRLDTEIKQLANPAEITGFTGKTRGKYTTLTGFTDVEGTVAAPIKLGGLNPEGRTSAEQKEFDRQEREKARIERARLARQKILDENAARYNQYVGQDRYSGLIAQAKEQGFNPEDLVNVYKEGKSKIELFDFKQVDEATGVTKRFKATVDELGNVLPEVSRKFRSFGQSIVRDIGELTKWSIAMAVIYGPIQKLGELTQLMIQNEVKLAEATIAVNDKFSSSEKIFNAAALAANNAGEEINTTIQAFTAAYRATGGGADETTRFATAQTLLADSMTLAKLAGIDESSAIDALSASLRQTGMGLTQGSELLDKWVKTTQVANVDLQTLATGFAVVGDTAQAAGLDIDHINGLIATVAETGLAAGKEAANATRRVVASFETSGAVKELNRLGIATEDANGKQRNFLEIAQQIYDLRQKKGISDEQFANLTLVAGQGVRGQATLSAVLSNLQRVGQIAAESGTTRGGEAAQALEKQLTTAQTAITRFNNSFQAFAQTLGTKGGLLDLFKLVTNGGSGLVKILNAIVDSLGKATPMVVAMTAALVALRQKPLNVRRGMAAEAELGIAESINNLAGVTVPRGGDYGKTPGYRAASWLFTGGQSIGAPGSLARRGSQSGFGALTGLSTAAIPAAMNMAAGDTQKALADIGGGIAGGIAGSLIGGPQGALIGSSIGTSIAEVFISLTRAEFSQIDTGTTPRTTQGVSKNISNAELAKSSTEEKNKARLKELEQQIISGVDLGGAQFNLEKNQVTNYIKALQKQIDAGSKEGINNFLEGGIYGKARRDFLKKYNITKETAFGLLETPERRAGKINIPSDLEIASGLSKNTKAVQDYKDLANVMKDIGQLEGGGGKLTEKLDEVTTRYSAEIARSIMEGTSNILRERSLGTIKTSQYNTESGNLAGASAKLPQWILALGGKVNSKELKDLMDIITYGSEEAQTELNNLSNSINLLKLDADALSDPEKRKQLESYMAAYKAALADTSLTVKLGRTNVLGISGDMSNPMTNQEYGRARERYSVLEKKFYSSQAGGGLSDSETRAYVERTFQAAAIPIKEGGQLIFKAAEKMDPTLWQQVLEDMKAAGELTSQGGGLDFSVYKDVDRATLEALAAQSVTMGQTWAEKFGYGGKPEDQIAIAKDGVAKPLHADFKILQFLLEKLVDQGQKQLDGMFNLPEGSFFWVNLAAAKMHLGTVAAGAGTGTTPITTGEGTKPIVATNPVENLGNRSVEAKLLRMEEALNAEAAKLPKVDRSYDSIENIRAARKDLSLQGGIEVPPVDINKNFGGWFGSQALPTINATNNLNFNWTTTLLIDGRVLNTVMKQYSATDINKMTTAGGVTTKDFIV